MIGTPDEQSAPTPEDSTGAWHGVERRKRPRRPGEDSRDWAAWRASTMDALAIARRDWARGHYLLG